MTELPFGKVISFDRMVSLESSYEVSIDQEYMPRLSASCVRINEPVRAAFKFYSDLQGLRTIEGTLDASVTFVCQRCQKEFVKELHSSFRSTCDEQKAKSLRIDEKLDIVELNEDGSFNLLDFLEDCLLLEIPFITSHEQGDSECLNNDGDWSFGKIAKGEEDNPFAKLAALKDSLKS
ncbi:MAG: YceD family protein [Succinivibrio sp.]